MEEDKLKEDAIQMIRSNHFVQEYLEQKGVAEEIKRNPRFQSIIWHISVMLKRQEIDFTEQEAVKWIQDNIKIGEQGKEIMYAILEKDGYYPTNFTSRVQFIKYFCDREGMKREVVELGEQGEQTLQILSKYNEDGIEESQFVDEKQSKCISIIQRVENRPELKSIANYNKETKQITAINYEKRFFWVALEDLSPNLIEVDPIETNPLLKCGTRQFYLPFSSIDRKQIQLTGNRILPLPEIDREEQLQYYKESNENYHRTKVFEKGIAKMLMVRNRDIKR